MAIDETDSSFDGRGGFAVSRRNLLKGIGATAVATSLAGCIDLTTNFTATPLGWFSRGGIPGTISFKGHRSRTEKRDIEVLGLTGEVSVTAEATGWEYEQDGWLYRVGVLSIPTVEIVGQKVPIQTPVDGPLDEVLTRDRTRELFNAESEQRLKTLNLNTVMESNIDIDSWNPPIFLLRDDGGRIEVAGRRGTGTTTDGETYNVEAALARGTTREYETPTPATTLVGVVRMQNAEDGDLPEDTATFASLQTLINNMEPLDGVALEELN